MLKTIAFVALALSGASVAQAKDVRPAAVMIKPVASTSVDVPAPVMRRVAKRDNLFGMSPLVSLALVGAAGAVVTGIAVATTSSSSPN